MAVSGIPIQKKTIEIAVNFAFRMLEKVQIINKELGTNLQIRIGINSGTVLAGIVGKKRFIYDLLGDTVNIASYLKKHGRPGKIHVSDKLYEKLKDKFNFEKTDLTQLKKVGPITTYYCISEK